MRLFIPGLLLCAGCFAQSSFPSGLTRFAGKDTSGQTGDNGPAYYATLRSPVWLALDPSGNIYVSDAGHIRKIDTRGLINTVITVDSATPGALAVDAQGNIVFALGVDIQRVTSTGVRTTLVKNAYASSLAFDAQGQLYFIDGVNGSVRVLHPDGTVTTITGGILYPAHSWMAAWPLSASPATSSSSKAFRKAVNPLRTMAWSSTSITRIGLEAGVFTGPPILLVLPNG